MLRKLRLSLDLLTSTRMERLATASSSKLYTSSNLCLIEFQAISPSGKLSYKTPSKEVALWKESITLITLTTSHHITRIITPATTHI